jgi:hypothetical protein
MIVELQGGNDDDSSLPRSDFDREKFSLLSLPEEILMIFPMTWMGGGKGEKLPKVRDINELSLRLFTSMTKFSHFPSQMSLSRL